MALSGFSFALSVEDAVLLDVVSTKSALENLAVKDEEALTWCASSSSSGSLC